MGDIGQDVHKLMEAAMSLRIRAEALQGAIEEASTQARRAILHYPKLRRLLNRCLNQAAGQQQRAVHLGEQMHGLQTQITILRREQEGLICRADEEHFEVLAGVGQDLLAVQEIVQSYGTVPGATSDDGAETQDHDGATRE